MGTQITFSPAAQNLNKNAETLREEIDYESEFKSLKGIAGDAEEVFEFATQRNDIKLVSSSAVTALSRNWKNFEDTVQYTVGEANGVICGELFMKILLTNSQKCLQSHSTAQH